MTDERTDSAGRDVTDLPGLWSEEDEPVKLLRLAAAIARGEYHPSGDVEDYRKGTGRIEFADLAGDYADRLRGQVPVMRRAVDRIRDLEAALAKREAVVDAARLAIIEHAGWRKRLRTALAALDEGKEE